MGSIEFFQSHSLSGFKDNLYTEEVLAYVVTMKEYQNNNKMAMFKDNPQSPVLALPSGTDGKAAACSHADECWDQRKHYQQDQQQTRKLHQQLQSVTIVTFK